MDEQELWRPADDEAVRGALDLLRRDVESLPLADVRFIKVRGSARRRRAMVVGVASAAAAVVAIGFVASNTVGSNQGLDGRPAASNTAVTNTSSPTVTNTSGPTTPVAAPGPLLVASEWQRALGFTGTLRFENLQPGGGETNCVGAQGTQLAMVYASVQPSGRSAGFGAVQGTYRATSPAAGNAAAAFAVSQLLGCRQQLWKAEADAAWPKVFSSPQGDPPDSKVWFIVAHQGALTSLLSLGDPRTIKGNAATPGFSLAQIQALALVAQQRLVQEVEGASSPSASSTQTDPGPATTQTAR